METDKKKLTLAFIYMQPVRGLQGQIYYMQSLCRSVHRGNCCCSNMVYDRLLLLSLILTWILILNDKLWFWIKWYFKRWHLFSQTCHLGAGFTVKRKYKTREGTILMTRNTDTICLCGNLTWTLKFRQQWTKIGVSKQKRLSLLLCDC